MAENSRPGVWRWVIYALGSLPLRALFLVSDGLYLLVYYVLRYRRKVVSQNLKKVFPEKSPREIQKISRRYYRHLCDLAAETLRGFCISDEELARRVVLQNPDAADRVIAGGKGALVLGTHYGNNEWMSARIDLMIDRRFPAFAVYNPFSNKTFDALMLEMRTRRGVNMIPMRKAMSKAVASLREVCMFGFITDQTPRWGQQYYYTSFFGVPTAWYTSISKIALRTGAQVFMADMRKTRRGNYTLELVRLPVEDFLPESEENIRRFTDLQVEMLEEMIGSAPEFWLWSHRRWKRPPQEGDGFSEKLWADYSQ
ncbi:MAG: lysophospholipid acyltransferase family protein [Bacteroidia bacterium]